MKKTNLFYYCPSLPWGKGSLMILTPPLYLNSYLRIMHPELFDRIRWQKLQLLPLNKQELVDKIIKFDIDILCITLYMWNQKQILEQIKNIKSLLAKKIKIVVGGPSVEIVRDKNFLNDNPDIDFAVYAQGEKGFTDVLNHVFGIKKLSLLDSKNVAWRENGKTKIADFELIRLEKLSPYLNSQELFKQLINDPDYKDVEWVLPYETSRGCPYNCSFCDWTSGLTHKTYHRKFSAEEEFEFFGENGVTRFHLSDANFGQVKQDLELAETMLKLKQTKGYDFKIESINFSKLQKARVFLIAEIFAKGDIIDYHKFAVQDTHEEILNNIERPDIPWPEHKNYIVEINKKYPKFTQIELIQGLPGQTRELWENNFIKIEPWAPLVYFWTILPNSPAGYDEEYRTKMKLKVIPSSLTSIIYKYDDLVPEYEAELVVGTYSYDIQDYAYMTLISYFFTNGSIRPVFLNKDRSKIFEMIKKSPDLSKVLNNIETGIKSSDLNLLSTTMRSFAVQIVKANIKEFNKSDILVLMQKTSFDHYNNEVKKC